MFFFLKRDCLYVAFLYMLGEMNKKYTAKFHILCLMLHYIIFSLFLKTSALNHGNIE